jgi:hypothetical protein
MTPEQTQLLDRIGSLLLVRQYNRRFYPEQSGAVELSSTEFVVACMYEFDRQVFINGFDGFVHNTDGEFTDFLPVALAAIGAHRYSTLARLAWENRADTKGRFDHRFFELIQEEPYGELLIAYVERHLTELPDPALATPEFFAQWKDDKQRWWTAKHGAAVNRSTQ